MSEEQVPNSGQAPIEDETSVPAFARLLSEENPHYDDHVIVLMRSDSFRRELEDAAKQHPEWGAVTAIKVRARLEREPSTWAFRDRLECAREVEQLLMRPLQILESALEMPLMKLDRPQPERFELRSAEQVISAPSPEYMLGGHLVEGSFAVLYGPSGVGKTFLALDWACCIATGLPWAGCAVKRGPVIYVAAEGWGGLGKRLTAWKRHHNIATIDDLLFMGDAVNLGSSSDVESFLKLVSPYEPSLVVFDTLARCLAGSEENSAKEVGLAIYHLDVIRRSLGAAVLPIHHTGKKDTQTERGSSALRGAADTMALLNLPQPGRLALSCDKQKDDEPFKFKALNMRKVASSIVLDVAEGTVQALLTAHQQTLLGVFGQESLRPIDMQRRTVLSESTCRRVRQELVSAGYLEPVEGLRNTYRITAAGVQVLAATSATAAPNGNGGKDQATATTTSLEVVVGGGRGVRVDWKEALSVASRALPLVRANGYWCDILAWNAYPDQDPWLDEEILWELHHAFEIVAA